MRLPPSPRAFPWRFAEAYREALSGIPRPIWLLSAVVLVNRAGTMVLPFLALYLTGERGFGSGEAGLAIACYGAGALAGSWLGGLASDRFELLDR